MSTPRMTETEARRAGLLPPRKARTTRKTEPRGGAESRCCTCDATFTTDAAETRHVEGARHARYESSLFGGDARMSDHIRRRRRA